MNISTSCLLGVAVSTSGMRRRSLVVSNTPISKASKSSFTRGQSGIRRSLWSYIGPLSLAETQEDFKTQNPSSKSTFDSRMGINHLKVPVEHNPRIPSLDSMMKAQKLATPNEP